MQENLAGVGISVTLNFMPGRGCSSCSQGGPLYCRTFDTAEFTWVAGSEPQSCDLYMSSHIPTAANGWSGQNTTGYSNPAFDAVCTAAMAAPSQATSVPFHQQAIVMLAEDVPFLPLYFGSTIVLEDKALNPGLALDRSSWSSGTATPGTSHAGDGAPRRGVVLTGSGGAFTATFPAGAFGEPVGHHLHAALPGGAGQRPDRPQPGLQPGDRLAGQRALRLQTLALYTISVTYTDAEMAAAVITDESTLAFYCWNGTAWVREPSSVVDTAANIVTAYPNHLSTWIIAAPCRRRRPPPRLRQPRRPVRLRRQPRGQRRSEPAPHALFFDGQDDGVGIVNHGGLDVATALTLEAWIKPADADNGVMVFCALDDPWSWTGGACGLLATTSEIWFIISTPSTDSCVYPVTLSPDTWYHVAGTFDGSTMTIYLNGVAVATKQHPNPGSVSRIGSLVVGRVPVAASSGSFQSFYGTIDELRFWTVVRSEPEIAGDMHRLLGGLEWPGRLLAIRRGRRADCLRPLSERQ